MEQGNITDLRNQSELVPSHVESTDYVPLISSSSDAPQVIRRLFGDPRVMRVLRVVLRVREEMDILCKEGDERRCLRTWGLTQASPFAFIGSSEAVR